MAVNRQDEVDWFAELDEVKHEPRPKLDHISNWGESLSRYLQCESAISELSWMRFRPDPQADGALIHFSIKYPAVVERINRDVEGCDKCLEAIKADRNADTEDALAEAMMYLLRAIEQSVAAIAEHEQPASVVESNAEHPGFLKSELKDMTGLGNTALTNHAKDAGVTTGGRGKKDYRYPTTDVRKILTTVMDKALEENIRQKAAEALKSLP